MQKGMNTSSINGFSPSHLQSMLSHQLTSNSLNTSSSKNAKTADASPFAQMMSDIDAAAHQSAPKVGKVGNFLQQIMSLL